MSLLGDKKARKEFLRYIAVGFSALFVDYLCFFLVFRLSGNEIAGNITGMLLGAAYTFLLNRAWSFGSKNPAGRQVIRYAALFVFNIAASNLLMYIVCVRLELLRPEYFKIALMGVISLWNFFAYKFFVFRGE